MKKNIEKDNTQLEQLLNFAVVTQNSGSQVLEIIDKKGTNKWVNWGENNKLPEYLWDAYLKCSNLQTIVNSIYDYVVGEGITSNFTEDITNVIEKCILDYIIFGGFTLECIRNRKGDIATINYVNVMNIRVNEELTTAFYSDKWGSYAGRNITELPLYNENEVQDHFIYFYRGNITRGINPIPTYIGCLKSVEILNGTRNFHLNNLKNNFQVNAIINLNNGNIKKKELEEIKDKLETNFTGTDNAGKFLLINNPDREHQATVVRLESDKFGDLYSNLQTSSENDLFVAFRINPILVGQNVATGFSKEEFENAYKLFNATVIKGLKNKIKKCFGDLGIELTFTEFKIDWE
jgi:capsid portal protein